MPNLITQQQYDQTILTIQGETQLNPVFREMKAWYAGRAGFEIYNFIIQRQQVPAKQNRARHDLIYLSNGVLSVQNGDLLVTTIYETKSDTTGFLAKFNQSAFNHFFALCRKHKMFTDIEWGKKSISGYDFNPIWWCEKLRNFGEKAIPSIRQKYQKAHLDLIINSGLGVITIFFKTDKDLQSNITNGLCASMEDDINRLFAKTDVDNRLLSIYKGKRILNFSSHETLNRDYKGNLYYFYK